MLTRIERTTNSVEETMRLAAALARGIVAPIVIALRGPLGSGKTAFVRGLATGLGIDAALVASPTFVLCREYPGPAGLRLAHLDAYRLGGADDLESIGWDELCEDERAIIAIEWPERVEAALPSSRIDITFEHGGPTTRRLVIMLPREYAAALEEN